IVMNHQLSKTSRRAFLAATGAAVAGTVLSYPTNLYGQTTPVKKMTVAIVGTGVRALGMWSKDVQAAYPDRVEFVGLCDINPGRLAYAKKAMGFTCPTFTDFDKMMRETKPDTLIVTTVDATHHEFIIKGMEMGADIITEKPMTTDEDKCEKILAAEKRTGK